MEIIIFNISSYIILIETEEQGGSNKLGLAYVA